VTRGEVAGLVLAAGEGRRIGGPKALIELGGRTLLARAVGTLRDGGCAAGVTVVVSPELAPGVADADVRLAVNPHWRAGMGSSLRRGLALVRELGAPAVVVMLVDQPLVGPAAVARLVTAYEAGAAVAVATYAGRPRNPVLLAREHWDAVAALAVGDVGARPFLVAQPGLVVAVECGDVADPADIDTAEDLRRHRDGLAGAAAP
jgi:nicotine blue oxidoreductase